MEPVEELLRKADELMDRAEAQIVVDVKKGRRLFQEAVASLEQAYLSVGNDKFTEDLPADAAALFEKCLKLEPDFETIRAEIDLLTGTDCDDDSEIICDAVNEIWDFMYGLMEDTE